MQELAGEKCIGVVLEEAKEPQGRTWWVFCLFKNKNALVQVYIWSNVWLLSWKVIKQSNASEEILQKVICALSCIFPGLKFIYCTGFGGSDSWK